jgi:hypothetical protein
MFDVGCWILDLGCGFGIWDLGFELKGYSKPLKGLYVDRGALDNLIFSF